MSTWARRAASSSPNSFIVIATSQPLAVILVSTYAETDLAEMIAVSPAVGFLQKFTLSPDAIRDLLEITGPQGR